MSQHIFKHQLHLLYIQGFSMPLVFEYFEFILSVNIPSLMHLIPWITIVARIIPPPNSENIKKHENTSNSEK